LLDYYSDVDIPIIITDSSSNSHKIYDRPNVHYFHEPGCPPSIKIKKALNYIKTPFFVFCADDDFIVPQALKECTEFLKNNPDYEMVLGTILQFTNMNGDINYRNMYPHSENVDIKSDESLERIRQLYGNYIQTFYVVRRVDSYENVLHEMVMSGIDNKLFNQIESMLSIIDGKMKVLPVFFGAREYIQNSANQSMVDLVDIQNEQQYIKVLDRFYDICANYLSKRSALTFDDARDKIVHIYSAFIRKRAASRKSNTKYIYRIVRYIKRKMIQGKNENFDSHSIKSEALSFLDNEEINELDKITTIIRKHEVI